MLPVVRCLAGGGGWSISRVVGAFDSGLGSGWAMPASLHRRFQPHRISLSVMNPDTRGPASSRTQFLLSIVAVSLFASACSGGIAESRVATLDADLEAILTSDVGVIPGEDSVLAFTECLRGEGLEVDDPSVDSEGNLVAPTPHAAAAKTLDMTAVHSAFDVCKDYLDGVAFGMSSEDQTEREDELLAFAVCMRENGYHGPLRWSYRWRS